MDSPDAHNYREPLPAEIAEFISEGRDDERRFAEFALRLAGEHYRRIPLYRKLAEMRGWSPDGADDYRRIPAVPVEAFKRTLLHFDPSAPGRIFSTSGTSGGAARKGRAHYSEDDLALMDAAIDVNARRYLFPDFPKVRTRLLILAPPPAAAPEMIMAYGMDRLRRNFGRPESCFLVGAEGLDFPRLMAELTSAVAAAIPVTLIGASFGFVHLFDALRKNSLSFKLPPGSRAMDAGGFKGRSREATRAELLDSFGELFGIEPRYCVNLLGLTEHASQFYDDTIAAAHEGRPARAGKQNPPWTRTWAADPETLRPAPSGEPGLLMHLDLANGGHPFMVQTDDLGVAGAEGFEVRGRAGGAESRGCSITVDEMMSAKRKDE